MQRNEKLAVLSVNSPLGDIAKDIGEQYLRRPFPYDKNSEGLLDYSVIRKQDISTRTLHRQIHGYQNACRLASLIPHLVSFYRRHATKFSPEIQRQLNELTDQDIKLLQIVSLLRSTGRNQDGNSGSFFGEQGARECAHYLRNMGLEAAQVIRFSRVVDQCEEKNKSSLPLMASLLADATSIETLRDTYPKDFYIHYYAFYQQLEFQSPAVRAEAIEDFLRLASAHAEVIQRHQGYLLVGIRERETGQLMRGWTVKLNDYPTRDSAEHQCDLENDAHCFDICTRDVAAAQGQIQAPTPASAHMTCLTMMEKEAKLSEKHETKAVKKGEAFIPSRKAEEGKADIMKIVMEYHLFSPSDSLKKDNADDLSQLIKDTLGLSNSR